MIGAYRWNPIQMWWRWLSVVGRSMDYFFDYFFACVLVAEEAEITPLSNSPVESFAVKEPIVLKAV